jgi:hypothetical protein
MHEDEEEAASERRARSHSARAEILALLEMDERGLTLARIRAALPGDPNLPDTRYHLRVLEVCRMIARDGDRYRRLW